MKRFPRFFLPKIFVNMMSSGNKVIFYFTSLISILKYNSSEITIVLSEMNVL